MVDKSPSGGYNREKQEKSWGDERPGVMIMTKADKYLVEDIKNILENGFQDVDPRPKYEDGTPAHTISVNHVMRKYDLSKGEFPICTLRPQAWKTGVREIFTIYQKPTNDLAEMREMGVTWWDPWDIGDGTIGQRYGATVKRYDLIHKIIEDIEKNPEHYQFHLEECDRIPYMAPDLVGPEKAARGKTPTDTWWHTIVSPNGKEKTGYPTQKPLGILERIVKVHSRPGDLLMDFFAGSGSFGEAAARLGRDCILVDNNPEAIAVMERRFAPYPTTWRR